MTPRVETLTYRGKHYTVPILSSEGPDIEPHLGSAQRSEAPFIDADLPSLPPSPILESLNRPFDLAQFLIPRAPLSLGFLPEDQRTAFARPGMPRTLDLPIKFPGSAFRLPAEFAQLAPVVQWVADWEARINPACYDEYYCYLTVDQGRVRPGMLQREAPCHVDGFQGARWQPKVRANHTYTLTDKLPTVYYPQPFDFSALDEAKHNFFWEMNRQVALTRSAHAVRPAPFELTLMDAYTVHRGDEAREETERTWVRLSFEVRVFDRLGNAHNPRFRYRWDMVPRDIEGLGLVAFDPECDPSLRVFPWQDLDGQPLADRGQRTRPRLT